MLMRSWCGVLNVLNCHENNAINLNGPKKIGP